MRFFINDVPVKIDVLSSKLINKPYDRIIEREHDIIPDHFKGQVLMRFPFSKNVSTVIRLIQLSKINGIESLTIICENKKLTSSFIKKHFRVIKAAGGLVLKQGKVLLIHRMGVWDLPKGKIDEGEGSRECAVREIEEECGVVSRIVDELATTWHSYVTKSGKSYLKKTDWYLLENVDDSRMQPQTEEFIDAIDWFSVEEAAEKLEQNSYNSIRHVFKKFQKRFKPIPTSQNS